MHLDWIRHVVYGGVRGDTGPWVATEARVFVDARGRFEGQHNKEYSWTVVDMLESSPSEHAD